MNEKMSWILISAVTIVIIGLLIVIDWIAQPPPDPGPGPRVSADVVKANIKGNLDEIVCDFAKGAGANGNSQSSWVFSEDDGDKEAKRSGSAPLLCDKQRLGIVIVRQYCRNSGSSTQWNNEIEEIDFPKYAEIWLSDDLYAGLANPGSFAPPPELLQDLRKTYSGFVIRYTWKARRFSDVLPSSSQAALDCREDFDGIEKFE